MITLVIPTWFIYFWAFCLIVGLINTFLINKRLSRWAIKIAEFTATMVTENLHELQKKDKEVVKKCTNTQKQKSPSQKSQKK